MDIGSYRFKKSGSANAAEKRKGSDTPTREGYVNIARPGSPPIWRKKGQAFGGEGTSPRQHGGMKIIGPKPTYGFGYRRKKGK
jgi:hypothetical protein